MKYLKYCPLLFAIVGSALVATERETWELDGFLRVSLPQSFEYGVPFTAEIALLEPLTEPQQMRMQFHYQKEKGVFAGGLQHIPLRPTVDGSERFEYKLAITQHKPDLTGAMLTIYLSPDGSWAKRTAKAAFPIMPANGDRTIYERSVENARKQEVRVSGNFEKYKPRKVYFEQVVDVIGERSWKPDPQNLPPLESILDKEAEDFPVYGIYSWAEEFVKAAEDVQALGFRSVRLAGPWGDAGPALDFAARNDIEVLFTLRGGKTWDAYRSGNRANFDSDEAFIENFLVDARNFVATFGPGGTYFADRPYSSPVRVVEVWNEPNFFYLIPDSGNRPQDEADRARLYAKLLPAAYETIKSVAPDLKVAAFAAGGAANADVRFIKSVLNSNPSLGDAFDVLSTHPYTLGAPPEANKYKKWGDYAMAENFVRIKQAMNAVDAGEKPVWYTEMGWNISQEHGGTFPDKRHRLDTLVRPDMHAAYTVRMYLWAMRLGVSRVHVMHLYDSDGFNGGFLDRETLEWRPVAHAVAHLIDRLPNPKLIGSQSDGVDNIYIYDLLDDHQSPNPKEVTVFWAVEGPREVSLDLPTARAIIYDMVGNQRIVSAENGYLKVITGPYPLFIEPIK